MAPELWQASRRLAASVSAVSSALDAQRSAPADHVGPVLHIEYEAQHAALQFEATGHSGVVSVWCSDVVQFCPDFLTRRSDVPRPRASIANMLQRGASPEEVRRHAPALIPPSLLLAFTLNATVPLRYAYRPRETATPNSSTRRRVTQQMLQETYEEVLHREAAHDPVGRYLTTLRRYAPLTKGRNLVASSVGVGQPLLLEVAALTIAGARTVTSVEVEENGPLEIDDARIASRALGAFWVSNGTYDAGLAFDTLKADGLGRRADALDPFGDLRAMNEWWGLLKVGGLLIISVPVGNDCLVFNVYRVYGRRRLPLLLRGWSIVEAALLDPLWFADDRCSMDHTVIIVLKRVVPVNQTEELLRVPGLIGDFPIHAAHG